MTQYQKVAGSFRDPSGFIFSHEGTLYRQVSEIYREHYDALMQGGLYEALVAENLLIPHEEVAPPLEMPPETCRVIKPRRVPFISYPYEWSFSQLKDAALLTLRIQDLAAARGMTLKDASAYNVQFLEGRPVFIDTLSFERAAEGRPWIAYRQFCQHFLAPLYLMATTDIRLSQMSRIFIDGIPLDLADRLLPLRARFSPSCFMHIHLHARYQGRYGGQGGAGKQQKISANGLRGILDNLASAIRKLQWQPKGTVWANYYSETNYSDEGLKHKGEIVSRFLDRVNPSGVWDIGANNGYFSRIAAGRGIPTVSMDYDPAAVEQNYRLCRNQQERNLLPVIVDLTNPSGDLGWSNEERQSLLARGPVDTAFALALIHHLAIANNIPLDRLAVFFARLCRRLVIEFVPKEDSQTQRLLAGREDVFPSYTREGFEAAFAPQFQILESHPIQNSLRVMYLMERR